MKHLAVLAMAALLGLHSPGAPAQVSYPSKPIKLIVPVTTGGPSDLVARILGDKLAASLGKPVVVENRPGASQSVGAAAVAKSDPDGYTLLQAAANMAINPILMSDLPYDTAKDFAPISLTHLTPYVFVVSSQSPINTLAELLKFVRENPGKVTYGTTGEGSPQQLATLLLAQAAGLRDMTEVAYKGSSAAHPDLISNRITFMIDPLAASAPHIRSGALRALAVSTPQRNANFPNVPTAIEAGVAGYDFASWGGIFAPAGTPRDIVLRLNGEIGKALAGSELRKRLDDMGLVAKASSPEEFGAFLFAEMSRWKAVLGGKKP
ncbi:MAG TPA: tripartite tricarboxylate transporter substrate binding protein [Burkholderiales bacterium]|nr:tripartite tricarboxylate transporter substrate binding protein [Burkholderiales bacterium]